MCTTHQLLRFAACFALIIIDEVDAFPFVNTPYLKRGARLAVNKTGHTVLLTATPSKEMLARVNRRTLLAKVLPARFHRQPLPQPDFLFLRQWQKRCLKKIPSALRSAWQEGLWLIFCPNISWLKTFSAQLEREFPEKKVVAIYASDPERHEKVLALRNGAYDLVVMTTILERGVTLTGVQVTVLGSHLPIFTKEVLVKIAGRVGRHQDYPTGRVIFVHEGQTLAMKKARQEIRQLNAESQKRGLIHAMH